MREIREAEKRVLADLPHLKVVCLHSELTKEEQADALVPHPGVKIILATNIAESSVTFPRVKVVIDSGLARQKEYRSGSGLERLVTRYISQASAIQRAGRAGRVGPGHVLRLYDEKEFSEFRKLETPEALRTDPVEVAFEIYRLEKSPAAFPLLSPPNAAALATARRMLESFDVVRDERLTRVGHELRELPLSPRLGLLFREVERTGLRSALLPLIVKLNEGEDLPDDAREAFGNVDFKGFAARRSYDQLSRLPVSPAREAGVPPEMALLRVFPERLARLDRGKCYFASGRVFTLGAKWSEENPTATYALILDAEEKDGTQELKIFSWLPISRAELEEFCVEEVVFDKRAVFDPEAGRILRIEEERFRELVIERWERAVDWEELGEAERATLIPTIEAHYFREGSALRIEREQLGERLRMHQLHSPALREIREAAFAETLPRMLLDRFGELRRQTPDKILEALRPTYAMDPTLDRLARDFPDAIPLPRRKRVPVYYESGKNPVDGESTPGFSRTHERAEAPGREASDHLAPQRSERSRRPGDRGSRAILEGALSDDSERAHATVPAAQVAGGSVDSGRNRKRPRAVKI